MRLRDASVVGNNGQFHWSLLESFIASCTLTCLIVLIRVVRYPRATGASEKVARDRTSLSGERREASDRHDKKAQQSASEEVVRDGTQLSEERREASDRHDKKAQQSASEEVVRDGTQLSEERREASDRHDKKAQQSIARDEHPLSLFLLELKKYLPSMAAFAWIMYMDSYDTLGFNHVNRDGGRPFYMTWCSSNEEPIQFFCFATRPVTRLFPVVGLMCVIIMPIHNLMHLRVRHVLMRRGILLVFGNKKRLGFFMCALVALFLLCSFAHLALKFFFAKDRYCDSGTQCTPEKLFDTFGRIGLHSQSESLFHRELNRTLHEFIGPSCIAFVLLAAGSNVTSHTVTIDEFFQDNLRSRARRFRQSILISEAEAETIVKELVVKPPDEHLSAYDNFYDLAIIRDSYISIKRDDTDEASSSEDLTIGEDSESVFTMITTALKHMVFVWMVARKFVV
eukprot:TRINITY_DN8576_c0_g1_i3.p1 TRINITY_DN8576_c0_g1~~TRINITY_DN8576_c0_g1_i3.p1  ORF type:complete len:454 (+),score=34.46 TRINITY_DN8576_c0_g1_i3:95-1456(+)